MQVSLC